MSKNFLWLVVSSLMTLSLMMTACGPAAVEEKKSPAAEEKKSPAAEEKKQEVVAEKEVVAPAAQAPKYGGTLLLAVASDPTNFEGISGSSAGITEYTVNERLWEGDWTKGAAGGYGTNETDWDGNSNLWHLNAGVIAESVKWTVDEAKSQGTIVYQIRQGVRWALNPKFEASRLVAGRELTTDDVIFHLRRAITDPGFFIPLSAPELARTANITKTGPWEITIKVRLEDLITAIDRFSHASKLVSPEVVQKYGGQKTWHVSVGTGPFMLTDYVPGSTAILDRNPNYWMKDPIGPGKGNQLPYLDRLQYLIIPDRSTRLAAFRTGKIDQIERLAMEDAEQMRRTVRGQLVEKEVEGLLMTNVTMRVDMPPFNDLRVRRAMLMAIDFKGLYQSIAGGKGRMLRRPVEPLVKGYEILAVEFDDPERPESVKENYSYNPEKARQLLKEAGYPQGLKTTALMTAAEVDDWSIYKDFWSKIGVDVDFMVRETGTYTALIRNYEHPPLVSASGSNPAIFYLQTAFIGRSQNRIGIDDPFINEISARARLLAVKEGLPDAMRLIRKMTIYTLEQVLEIPGINGAAYRMWWPWLKNYSGELNMGFGHQVWPKFVWLDQELKKSMGY